jgi:hypothetical protein
MKKFISVLGGMLVAVAVMAQDRVDKDITTAINTTGTVTLTQLSGYISEVFLDKISTTTTSNELKIAVNGETLYFGTNSADAVIRPTMPGNDQFGRVLPSTNRMPYLVRDSVVLSYCELYPSTNSTANWKITIKLDSNVK